MRAYSTPLAAFALLASLATAPLGPPPPAPPADGCLEPAALLPAACGPPPGCTSGFAEVAGLGVACPAGGLWWVRLSDGSHVPTHGMDFTAACCGDIGYPSAPRAPFCVGATADRIQVLYVVASGDTDRYATMAPHIRSMVAQANGFLWREAQRHGHQRDLRVQCDAAGVVTVDHVVVPTPVASDSFASIVSDLKALGYGDAKAKYWLYYDDYPVPGAAGAGTLCYDERRVVTNCSNTGPSYGMTYTGFDWFVMLHEGGHTMGAVSADTPHTSRWGHCGDEDDMMCYDDGGPGYRFSEECTDGLHFDCGGDDYFHPAPGYMTYTAHRWNIGWTANKFLKATFLCSDGLDNDADGAADLADGGCRNAEDVSEGADCADGFDSDGDGRKDLADDGCAGAADATEWGACGDGLDNDGDGPRDYPSDLGCADPDDGTEDTEHDGQAFILHEDFEDKFLGREHNDKDDEWLLGPTSVWSVTDACVDGWRAAWSPRNLAWTKAADCTFDNGKDIGPSHEALLAAPIDLTGKAGGMVEFEHLFELGESGDYLQLQASRDFATWTTLVEFTTQDTHATYWTKVRADLTPFAGGPVWLRFVADPWDSTDNDHRGWFIDGLHVWVA